MLMTQIEKICPRPFLKWAGGKSKLIQQYSPYFPQEFKNYYEPFLGGGAVFFNLLPSSAILTDINPDLINTYLVVQNHVDDLIVLLQEHQARHCKEYYYQVRDRTYTSQVEKAARLIYLNKTCFNGLYRENRSGKFNVPIGRYKNPNICPADLLRCASNNLKYSQIEVRSFDAVLEYAIGRDDFVYFDPPYHPLSYTSNFTSYSRYAFGENEQIKLRDTFAQLAKRGVKVMLSNSDCPFIRDIYSGFKIYSISADRSINSNASKRGKILEVVILSA